jgi:hypothetical protein
LLGVTARIGSDYIASVAVTGEGKVTISNENELKYAVGKLGFQPSVKLKPIELSVQIKTKAFVIFSNATTKTWKLWKEDVDLWTGSERVLVDLNKKKTA